MKKAILSRFTAVILLALILSSAISYYAMSKQFLKQNITHLTNILDIIQSTIDYHADIQEEIDSLCATLDKTIRITILDETGKVWADTDADSVHGMENHLEREEVQAALSEGTGYATRYSQTLHENMLYVAEVSPNGEFIVRLAIPFTGWQVYLKTIFPMLFAGIVIAFGIAIITGMRFTNTIIEPLYEISDEMKKAHTNELDFHFKNYRYKELNVISDATTKLTQEIRDHVAQIETERKIRQEFFSNASHELKTPITSIRGYAELLDNDFAKDEETKKNFLHRILKTTDSMTNLINDILMISRLETKEAEVTFSGVRMNPLLEEVFEALEPIAAENEVTLHRECEPITVEASAKQLRELLMNLVSNGITYNHPGGNVWVEIMQNGDDMLIKVEDDGAGISKAHQERIFERFYRVDKGRSKKMGGTGLGLAIVKHIVEFYEGKIELFSEIGKGSRFEVRIRMECDENVDKSSTLN